MNVVLLGQKWLAREVLQALIAIPRVRVLAVCPDNTQDRLAEMARSMGLPVVGMGNIPPCHMAVAAHCQQYIPPDIRARCGLGILAYHPSLLPRHRGRDAVHWTLAMRDSIAGGTAYWMDDRADTGPIEAQDWCHVLPGDTAKELWRRELAPLGLRLLTQSVARLALGQRPRAVPQDERVATWEPALSRARLQDR